MSPKNAKRFWDNDFHQNETLAVSTFLQIGKPAPRGGFFVARARREMASRLALPLTLALFGEKVQAGG
jgi:hypothetical protein